MKKGKVEFLYKIAALMENGQIGVDFFIFQERLDKLQLQKIAEGMKTDIQVQFIGTIIMPPKTKKDKNIFEFNYLTDEEREQRIKLNNEYASREYEEEQKIKKMKELENVNINQDTI